MTEIPQGPTSTPPQPPPQSPPQPPPQPPVQPPLVQRQGNGMAVAGMVLGIVGVVMFCIWYVALPCAIVGLVLSVQGLKKARQIGVGTGMANAGLILCIVALGLDILGAIFLAAFVLGILGIAAEVARECQQTMLMITRFLA